MTNRSLMGAGRPTQRVLVQRQRSRRRRAATKAPRVRGASPTTMRERQRTFVLRLLASVGDKIFSSVMPLPRKDMLILASRLET